MSCPRILRLKQILDLVGLSRSTVLRLEGRGAFPRKFNIGGARAVGWYEAEVAAWIAARRGPKADTATEPMAPR